MLRHSCHRARYPAGETSPAGPGTTQTLGTPRLAGRRSIAGGVLLSATLLTLGTSDARAEVYVGEDCIHPPNSIYADANGHSFRFTSFYIPPTVTEFRITNLVLSGFGNCSPPPPNIPGSAVTVDLSGIIDYDYDVYCVQNCDAPARHLQEPISGKMVVTFNHEEGPTRFFETAVQLRSTGGLYGSGTGSMTIEDLGGGIFRLVSHFGAFLTLCLDFGSGLDCQADRGGPALFTLPPGSLTDVPPGQAARSLTLAPPVPNPVRSRARIRFTLPSEGLATLKVYDLAGREVASLLDGKAMPAGTHDVDLDTQGWPPGCYFYRLMAGAWHRARKLIVLAR